MEHQEFESALILDASIAGSGLTRYTATLVPVFMFSSDSHLMKQHAFMLGYHQVLSVE